MIKYIVRPILINFFVNSLAIYGVTVFLENVKIEGGIRGFLLAGAIIGILNLFIKPILKIFSFPLLIFSLGIFMVIINGIIIYLLQFVINTLQFGGITMAIDGGIVTYILIAVVFGFINWILSFLLK